MQNIFPCTVMLLATGICAYLPVRAILNRCLSVREDVLFILFWYQSWIYLHLVPTINGLFPESTFAKPVRYLQLRVIQFTPEDIAWYAVFEVMILLLFYCPLLYFYGHFRKKKPGRCAVADRVAVGVAAGPAMGLAIFFSIFGAMFYEGAMRTGLLSTYANNIDVLASLSQYDRWVWRMYIITSPFLFTTLILIYRERGKAFPDLLFLVASAPAIILNILWILSSSRSSLAFLIMGILGVFVIRGHIRRVSGRTCLGVVLAFLLFYYGLNVIPKFRAIVLDDQATAEGYLAVLDPFDSDEDTATAGGGGDYGFRLDGIEIMVLAAPKMLDIGPLFGPDYAVSILSPVLPLIPSLERTWKFDEQTLDFKKLYMSRYTDITSNDYSAGALADIFMAFGPLGFCVAALTYGWLFAWLYRLIANRASGRSVILGIFLYYNVSLYEFPFASLPLGWVRGLPVLLIALAFNPFQGRWSVASCPSSPTSVADEATAGLEATHALECRS